MPGVLFMAALLSAGELPPQGFTCPLPGTAAGERCSPSLHPRTVAHLGGGELQHHVGEGAHSGGLGRALAAEGAHAAAHGGGARRRLAPRAAQRRAAGGGRARPRAARAAV